MEDTTRPSPPLITWVEKTVGDLLDPLDPNGPRRPDVHTRGIKWVVDNEYYGIWKVAGDDAEDIGKLGQVMWVWYLCRRYSLVRLYYQLRRKLRDLCLTDTTEACQLED